MALYYFNLHDGFGEIPDEEGCELPDLAAARAFALRSARALMAEDIKDGRLTLTNHIEVRDDGGQVVLKLPFS